MTITQLYTDLLDSIAKAQYNAYVFSENLGEQVKDNLFPIPIAEIKEVTLDVKYAYTQPPAGVADETEIAAPDVYRNMKPLLAQVLSKVQKRIIDEVDTTENAADAAWLQVKKSLLQGKLEKYILDALRKQFYAAFNQLVQDNRVNPAELLPLLLQNTMKNFIDHPDVQKHVKHLPVKALAREVLEEELQQRQQAIQQAVEAGVRKKMKGLDIIIDARELSELPPDAIQQARVVLDVRTILNENEDKP